MGLIPCPNRVDVPADSLLNRRCQDWDFSMDIHLASHLYQLEVDVPWVYKEVLKHLHKLWGFAVQLDQEDADGRVHPLAHCPELTPE